MLGKENRQPFAIITILMIASLLRLLGISTRPIWYDEAFAILFSEKGLGAMIYGTLTATSAGAADIHPLGYYTLLWAWMGAFGQSLPTVRLLSMLAGVMTVFFAYLLAKNLFSHRTALLGALFVSLSPFHVHYSQEIRMYAFLALWLMIAVYAYLRASRDRSWGWWAIFAVVAALAQYTHNLAAFFLIPLAITPLFRRDWPTFRYVSLAGLGALLLYLPWLVQLPSQFSKVTNAYWVERPGFAKLFTLLLTFVTNLPLPEGWLFPGLFVALAVVSISLLQTFRASKDRSTGVWLLYLSFAPPAFLFLFSQWVPVYLERALLPSGVIFCVWLAWSFFETRLPNIPRAILLGFLGIGFAVGLYQHITYRDFPYAPYQKLDQFLQTNKAAGDVIVHSNKLSLLPAIYHDRTLPQLYVADPPGSRIDTLAEATREVLGLTVAHDIETATKGANRVWFIIFERSTKEAQASGAETHPQFDYLLQNFTEQQVSQWDGLLVYQFDKKP